MNDVCLRSWKRTKKKFLPHCTLLDSRVMQRIIVWVSKSAMGD